MAAPSGNGYQKVPAVEGHNDDSADPPPTSQTKWIVGILIAFLACFGIYYVAAKESSSNTTTTNEINAVLSSSDSTLHVAESGRLKLFDDLSTLVMRCIMGVDGRIIVWFSSSFLLVVVLHQGANLSRASSII